MLWLPVAGSSQSAEIEKWMASLNTPWGGAAITLADPEKTTPKMITNSRTFPVLMRHLPDKTRLVVVAFNAAGELLF